MKNRRCILWPSTLRHLVLHRLGEPITHWRHPFPYHANVHVVVVILPIWFRRSRFNLRNHRLWGGLVRSSSRGGSRRGHLGYLAPGMLSGTAGGLLLLYRGLAMGLAMDAFPRLAPLALGAVPLLVTLLATRKALLVVVSTVPLCFHTGSLGTLA